MLALQYRSRFGALAEAPLAAGAVETTARARLALNPMPLPLIVPLWQERHNAL
ncbi:MAG: hypothetical protein ABSF59_14740 [Candidatus Sulfotelmatobacter sp.]|jgi:hypothetical protein